MRIIRSWAHIDPTYTIQHNVGNLWDQQKVYDDGKTFRCSQGIGKVIHQNRMCATTIRKGYQK
jgi:hypothetical protein